MIKSIQLNLQSLLHIMNNEPLDNKEICDKIKQHSDDIKVKNDILNERYEPIREAEEKLLETVKKFGDTLVDTTKIMATAIKVCHENKNGNPQE